MWPKCVGAVLALLLSVSLPSEADQTPPTGGVVFGNQEVVQLLEAGIDSTVIVAKIKQAPRVQFSVETDDIVKLKAAGASSEILAAMIESSGQLQASTERDPVGLPNVGVGPSLTANAILAGTDGRKEIQAQSGAYSPKVMTIYFSYPGVHAKVMSSDTKPNLLVHSDYDPRNHYFLVKLSSDQESNARLLKMNRKAKVNDDSLIPSSTSETKKDIWAITPTATLAPGEYGIYDGFRLFSFRIE